MQLHTKVEGIVVDKLIILTVLLSVFSGEVTLKIPFVRESSRKDETTQSESNLEVLGVEFEPIHQGNDNVVRVKVENTSGREQTFGIHIGTKCPEYRGRFSGWGRPFFDVLKSNEIKEIAFKFEIFWPITDTTWMALSFYNPASANEHDSKKWFKKTRYTSEDIEEIGIDRREPNDALKKETRLIKQVFGKMQDARCCQRRKLSGGLAAFYKRLSAQNTSISIISKALQLIRK